MKDSEGSLLVDDDKQRIINLNVQTQTEGTFTNKQEYHNMNDDHIKQSNGSNKTNGYVDLKEINSKNKTNFGFKIGKNKNFKSDDEDGYQIQNQITDLKYKIINKQSNNNWIEENDNLNKYIDIFEKAIDENNYEIIENMAILYSCTANYTSYYFSFDIFEKNHNSRIKNHLLNEHKNYPDIFARFFD